MASLNFLSCFLLISAVYFAHGSECEEGDDLSFGGYFYCFVRTQADYWHAQEHCNAQGAHLASIMYEEENDILQDRVDQIGNSQGFWIGLNSLGSLNNQFSWSDGNTMNFTKLPEITAEKADDKYGGRCSQMHRRESKWLYGNCGHPQWFICKRSEGEQPPPITKITAPTTLIPGYCPKGYFGLGDKCYKVVYASETEGGKGVTFVKALEICRSSTDGLYPDLASISNEEENAEVTSLLFGSEDAFWIGMFYQNQHWKWTDSSPVTYSNWDKEVTHNQPTDGARIQGFRYHAGSWTWQHREIPTYSSGYVCQVRKNPMNVISTTVPSVCLDCPDYCPSGYVSYWKACYRLSDVPMTWKDANSVCASEGGSLTSIHNEVENSAVFMFIKEHRLESNRVWIGLHDIDDEGEYSWSDDWAVMFTHWEVREPSVSGQCVAMNLNGKWVTQNCEDGSMPFVCRYTQEETVTRPPKPEGDCPSPKWKEIYGSCFYFTNILTDYYETADICKTLHYNAALAYIHSEEENRLLAMAMQEEHSDNIKFNLWIGFHRAAEGSEFTWYGRPDDPVEYINWSPDNTQEDNCVVMMNNYPEYSFAKWQTYNCDRSGYGICKTEKVSRLPILPPNVPGSCPDTDDRLEWVTYGDQCILFRPFHPKSFEAALEDCIDYGGQNASLVTVNNMAKDWFVHNTMLAKDPDIYMEYFWIGLRKEDDKHHWLDSGLPVNDFTNWGPRNPDPEMSTACVSMHVGNAKWEDEECTEERPYVCQVKKGQAQTTPTPLPEDNIFFKGHSDGAIAGAIIGSAAIAVLLTLLGVFLYIRHSNSRAKTPFLFMRSDSVRSNSSTVPLERRNKQDVHSV